MLSYINLAQSLQHFIFHNIYLFILIITVKILCRTKYAINFSYNLEQWLLKIIFGENINYLYLNVIFKLYKIYIIYVNDCSHEIKRHLLLGRKAMTNLDSILKSRDSTLSTNIHLVKVMVFSVVMYGCESWTIKKIECRRIDAFEVWCWRRLLRVPWNARRSTSQSQRKLVLNINWKD